MRLLGPIGKWDVSEVTDMSKLFCALDYFNYALSDWDVSRVTDMRFMFANALSFNQDLSKRDVSRVTNMVCACVSIDGVCVRVCGGRCACVCDIH